MTPVRTHVARPPRLVFTTPGLLVHAVGAAIVTFLLLAPVLPLSSVPLPAVVVLLACVAFGWSYANREPHADTIVIEIYRKRVLKGARFKGLPPGSVSTITHGSRKIYAP